MKFSQALGLLLMSSNIAWAGGLDLFQNTNQTPYQVLENAFNNAGPLTLNQLPTLKDYAQWACVGAKQDTTIQTLIKCGVPVLMQGYTTTPPTPSNGPLFPGQPFQTSNSVQEILFLYGRNTYTPDFIFKDYLESKDVISITPELAQSSLLDPKDPSSIGGTTFRMSNNMLVMKQSLPNTPVAAGQPDYLYCYKK